MEIKVNNSNGLVYREPKENELIMSADEMFEELGTIKTETESFITYTGKINKLARILLNKNNESITFEGFNAIRINELKAINKKCEELGWI